MDLAVVDYYARLGLSPQANADEIRRAYRQMARLYHPDVARHNGRAAEMFRHIDEAYRTLIDATKRHHYDHGRRPTRNPTSPRKKTARPPRPDLDIDTSLEISLEDAIGGATYLLKHEGREHHVEIPPGLFAGQRLRLQGLGRKDGNQKGDLYVKIAYARHSRFLVIAGQLWGEVPLSPWEAALGTRYRLPTLDGLADLHVPPGTTSGSRLKLEGYGLPQKNGTRGDLTVTVRLKIPGPCTDVERRAWRELARRQSG